MQTVLITGCSSGFGLDCARCFLARGWSVVATMRVVEAVWRAATDPSCPTRLPVSADAVALAGSR